MEQIIGYILLGVMGFVLGLLGGGGSILAVPILVYVMHIDAALGTGYSLFLVGLGALVGGIRYAISKKVHFPSVFVFGLPALAGVFSVRKWVIPLIPETLFSVGSFTMTKGAFIMLLFAVIMLAASVSMIRSARKSPKEEEEKEIRYNYLLILVEGLVVGAVTGFVGAGGGFLIVPALVLLANLPMKYAVGTSLFIIAIKSLLGFIGDIMNHEIDWFFLLTASVLVIVGIFAGTYTSKYISSKKLKAVFGWFVLIMGIFILLYESIIKQ